MIGPAGGLEFWRNGHSGIIEEQWENRVRRGRFRSSEGFHRARHISRPRVIGPKAVTSKVV